MHFLIKNYDFHSKFSLFIGVCTRFCCHCFCFVALQVLLYLIYILLVV